MFGRKNGTLLWGLLSLRVGLLLLAVIAMTDAVLDSPPSYGWELKFILREGAAATAALICCRRQQQQGHTIPNLVRLTCDETNRFHGNTISPKADCSSNAEPGQIHFEARYNNSYFHSCFDSKACCYSSAIIVGQQDVKLLGQIKPQPNALTE